MRRPVTLFGGQFTKIPLREFLARAKGCGYDGMEAPCWEYLDVRRVLEESGYAAEWWATLEQAGMGCWAISNHLVGQAVCDDPIDIRHKAILPAHVWGDGEPEGVRHRAAEEMKVAVRAARVLFNAAPEGVRQQLRQVVVNGFTGSKIWKYVYPFPPVSPEMIAAGYDDFAERFGPILDECRDHNVYFALEVHPTEIAFDLETAQRALSAVGRHERFGFNFDPSHLAYQGVDYLRFIEELGERIFHVHMKDASLSKTPKPIGVFGGHTGFGDLNRVWDFRSLGHGSVDFGEIIRRLNAVGYRGPLSVEWEDSGMDQWHGAGEACEFVRKVDFEPSAVSFEAGFEQT